MRYIILLLLLIGCNVDSIKTEDGIADKLIFYTDADKDFEIDNNLCGAAVAANMIAFSGYAIQEDKIFNELKDLYRGTEILETGIDINWAIEDYFDIILNKTAVCAIESDAVNIMSFIAREIDAGRCVGISLYFESEYVNTSHALTVFEYNYNEGHILYFTNSDDRKDQLVKGQFYFDGKNWKSQIINMQGYIIEKAVSMLNEKGAI